MISKKNISKSVKSFFAGLFNLGLSFIMWIPNLWLRKTVLRFFGAKIGSRVFIARKVEVRKPKNLIIGDNSIINTKVILDGRGGVLKIGKNVDIAQEAIIWTESHNPHDDYHSLIDGEVIIGDYVWIGCRAMVMPDIKIGEGSVVAALSVVTRNVESKKIVGGIPAKVIAERASNLKYTLTFSPFFG